MSLGLYESKPRDCRDEVHVVADKLGHTSSSELAKLASRKRCVFGILFFIWFVFIPKAISRSSAIELICYDTLSGWP